MTEGFVQLGRPQTAPPADTVVAAGGPRVLRIHPSDNVAVAICALAPGEEVNIDGTSLTVSEEVPAGHKIALSRIEPGMDVIKYGYPIGAATATAAAGAWVHTHNLRTRLEARTEYRYVPERAYGGEPAAPPPMASFDGYVRADGRTGTRNEVWVLNTVGCVNHAAEGIARRASERLPGAVDGIYTFAHPYGCSQLGDDLENTQRVLAGLLRNPNAGGVLVLGLGCENNQLDLLVAAAAGADPSRLRFFNSQDVGDEVEAGVRAVSELVELMSGDRRTAVPASSLVLGQKCGGSDGFSGVSANPLVGRISDRIVAHGGKVLLTEVPEMFGAEQLLMDRAVDEHVFRDIVAMIERFKDYFIRHGQPIYENPSPGNKAGGLTTLEEKSLGAIQKGGHAPVAGVLRYGEAVAAAGLSLLEAPGNDAVSSTAMVASGATLLLFTTGRGTPLGFPVPTLKIASNTGIAAKKPHWIDFNAGELLDGTATMAELDDDLFALVLDVASGRTLANNEVHGVREISIWKEGVTL